jgi:acyl CoA:acetate/3-ketoacid CoA transferase
MRGFNIWPDRAWVRSSCLWRQGGWGLAFSIRNPIIANPHSTHAKITIYLNKGTHRGVEAYAHQYGCSKNQAVVQVLKNQFHIVEDSKAFWEI